MRVIEYSVSTEAGTDVSELFCLVTDLLDPQQLSGPQAADAYAQRWQIETAPRNDPEAASAPRNPQTGHP